MSSFADWLTIAELLSGMAGGRNDSQAKNEALGISAAGGQNADQLNRDKFALAAPGARLSDSMRASYVKNYQPVTPGAGVDPASGRKVVHWNGGTNNPNMVDPETRQLAAQVEHQHLLDQMSGTDRKPITPTPPIGQSDVTSKLLAGGQAGATGMSILKLLGLLPFGKGGTASTQPEWWPTATGSSPVDYNPNHE